MNIQLKRRPSKVWQKKNNIIKKIINKSFYLLRSNFERLIEEIVRTKNYKINNSKKESKNYLKNSHFRKNGYLYVGNIFDYLEKDVSDKIDFNHPLEFYKNVLIGKNDLLKAINISAGEINKDGVGMIDISCESFLLKKLNSFFKEIYQYIEKYYGKQDFWLRNSPLLRIDHSKSREEQPFFSYYHLDGGHRQISLIILLNSTNENSSSTQVIPRTNNNSRFGYEFINRTTKRFINYAKIKEKKFGNKKLYGNVGSAYLIDAGNMLHRGLYGEDRLMLHFNFSQSNSYCDYKSPEDEEVIKFYFHNLEEKKNLL